MSKRYIVFKCSSETRIPIACFDSEDMDEAKNTLASLQKRHADEADFESGPGQFCEILEKSQVPEREWEEAMNQLDRQKGGRA